MKVYRLWRDAFQAVLDLEAQGFEAIVTKTKDGWIVKAV